MCPQSTHQVFSFSRAPCEALPFYYFMNPPQYFHSSDLLTVECVCVLLSARCEFESGWDRDGVSVLRTAGSVDWEQIADPV